MVAMPQGVLRLSDDCGTRGEGAGEGEPCRHPGSLGIAYSVESRSPAAIQVAGFGRICRGFLTAIGVHAKIRGVAFDQNSYQLAPTARYILNATQVKTDPNSKSGTSKVVNAHA